MNTSLNLLADALERVLLDPATASLTPREQALKAAQLVVTESVEAPTFHASLETQPWVHLCDVSVDSARLLIIDPGYIDKYWQFSAEKNMTPVTPSELSFAACFQTTQNRYRGGNVTAGEFGLGASLVSGEGDGQYGVYVKRHEDGDIAKILIDVTYPGNGEESR